MHLTPIREQAVKDAERVRGAIHQLAGINWGGRGHNSKKWEEMRLALEKAYQLAVELSSAGHASPTTPTSGNTCDGAGDS
jgi:hypothetical protein